MTTGSSASSSSAVPSHIFIVRHGARLDAADKDWSQSSPTPYDTPLTYGGWVQCRNLGVRIASLLHTYQPPKSAPKKKRQIRVVVHSSPFLRCIQTSASLVSGIAQHHHQQAVDAQWENKDAEPERFVKPALRLDAWLGEWMTTDYYTDITPPPTSQLMVGTTRNEYMRAPGGIAPVTFTKSSSSLQQDAVEEATLPTSVTGGFVPPSPMYAISNSGMIPMGYFSQAKEFVDFDCMWDSMKFGEGAELGEEWSTMHTRFRTGYKKLIQYYSNEKPSIATATTRSLVKKEKSSAPVAITCGNPTPPFSDSDSEDEEDDIETVVILVTHGAGVNALLGAITDKPVLIDIGIGSLSWGVLRSPVVGDTPTYDLKLTANTEHMRPSTPSASTPPRSPYLNARPRNAGSLGSFVLSSSGVSGSSLAVAMGGCKTQRSASTGNGARPTGLWTMPKPEDRERTRTAWVGEDSVVNGVASLGVGEKEKEEVMVPIERSGSVIDGGAGGTGLWAAKAWKSPPKRRWTVGREGWNGTS
jgi:broad specificity phosphatase PhoE